MRLLGPKRPQSNLERAIRWREWQRDCRFPGRVRWRQVTSEVHQRSMLTVKQRRERVTNSLATCFRFRLKGQYIGPMLFDC